MTAVPRAMRLWPESVRWRLTLWYSLALGLMLVAFAAGSFYVLQRVLGNRSDRFLEQARDAYITELRVEVDEVPTLEGAIHAAARDVQFRDIRFVVYDAALTPVAMEGAPRPRSARADDGVWDLDPGRFVALIDSARASVPAGLFESGLVTLRDSEGGYRGALRPVRLEGRAHIVAALHSRHPLRDTLETVAIAFALAIPLFLALSAAGGYLLARRALSPITAMSRRAREITATNLHERLPVENPRDELGGLATMVNDLLARLESSFEQQRRFVADASHELRTPVAIVRAESDITLARESRSEGEYRDAMRVVQDAGSRLSRIVEDLFLLARADAGDHPITRAELYLDELIADTARSLRAIAAGRDVRLELGTFPEAPFRGDGELLARLLLNLLDNAIKYSRPGAAVRVSLGVDGEWYEIGIADRGPGIPVAARALVFDRFFRGDTARPRSEATRTSGAGLGLAIARWVAEAHGGGIDLVRSDDSGSEFRVRLPRPAAEAAADGEGEGDERAADPGVETGAER